MLEMPVPYPLQTFSFLKKKEAKQDNISTQTYIFIASIFQPFCIGNSESERAQTQFLFFHAAVGLDVGFLQKLFTEI